MMLLNKEIISNSDNNKEQRKRIPYVDSMRAFAILSVVIGHLNYFTFDNCGSLLNQCINAYWMPLFILISGMFAKDEISLGLLFKRSYQLVLPFCVMGLFMCWHHGLPLEELFFAHHHAGYWFLLALFWMHIFYMLSHAIVRLFPNCRYTWLYILAMNIIIWIVLNVLLYTKCLPNDFLSIICIRHLIKLYPFYILGKYWMNFGNRLSPKITEWIVAVSFVGFGYMLLAEHYHKASYNIYQSILFGIFGCVIILQLFLNFPNSIIKNYFVSYVGKHTVEIYLLHYFFLPKDLSSLFTNISACNEVLVSLVQAIIVIAVSLLLAWCLSQNKICKLLLFGKL